MAIDSGQSDSFSIAEVPEDAPLAIAYTDIVGSTTMNRTLGDERARRLMHVHDRIVRSVLAKHGGMELQPTGDGFKLAFVKAADALRATVEMQSEFERYSADGEAQIDVRMGIHFGVPLHEGADIYGESVILAARVMARAGSRQVLVSEAVREAAGDVDAIGFMDCGRYHLKGFDEAFRLFELTWPGRPSTRVPVGKSSVELARHWQGTSFVGRYHELRKLEQCLESAEAARSRMALLEGEAGIGKSRLAFEFVNAFSPRIGAVASARCFSDLGGPFQPIVDLLVDLRSQIPEFILPNDDIADLAPLGHLSAELRDWFGDAALPETFSPPDRELQRLHAALVRFFLGVARDRTLVLIVDDIQWADDKTLDLLRLLGRQLGPGLRNVEAKLLVIALYREEGRRRNEAFEAALAELERHRMVERLALPRLQQQELRYLLSDLCSGQPSASFLSHVQRRSGGNPYFAEEIAADAIQRSPLHPADPRWRPAESERGIVPAGISAILEQRIATLSPTSRDILQTAEMLGTRFALSSLELASENPADEVLRAIEEGYSAGLLFEQPGTSDYSFYHSIVTEVLDGLQSPLERRVRHARIAAALEAIHESDIGAHVEQIARHLLSAADRAPADRLRRYAMLAGDRAIALHSYPEADRWYAVALEARPARGPDSADERADLEAKRALSLGRTGRLDEGRELAESAIRHFSRRSQPERVARTCEAIASCFVLHARHRDALPYLERALETAPKASRALRGRTLWHYATALDLTGRSEEMRATADEILEISGDLRSAALRERAQLIQRNWYANHTIDVAKARSLTRRVLRSAARREDVWDETLLLESLGLFELSLARIDRALEALDRALTLATDVGALAKIIDARGLRALCFTHRGQFDRVEEEWELARPYIGQVPGAIHLGQFLWARTRAKLWMGRFAGATTAPDTAYPGLEELETAEVAVAGMIASETGAPGAQDLLSAASRRHAPEGVGMNWMLAAQMLAAGWMNLGRVDEAIRWVPGLRPYHRTLSLTFPAVELGRIAAGARAWRESAERFAVALQIARREGLKPHLGIARAERARMWLTSGKPQQRRRAEREFEEAYETLARLGMQGALDRFDDLRPVGTLD